MAGAEPTDALCMACQDESCDFKPMRFQRRPLGPGDVLIDMKFCGVCHSDLHTAANHMAGVGLGAVYPVVPGHELAGVCLAVGEGVKKFKVGDHVGVGCMVDSCLECAECVAGHEQKCKKSVSTYNSKDFSGRAASYPPGAMTMGGYATKMVVHERFGILIPEGYPLEAAGPVMCSGITVYEPMQRYGAKEGTRLGVIGLGGLGIMAVKLGKALGCKVTAISRNMAKEQLATSAGAEYLLASGDEAAMAAAAGSLDLIINTIPTFHDWSVYQPLLAQGGKHVILGLHAGFGGAMLAEKIRSWGRTPSSVVSSMIGGVANTQTVIDLCAKNRIYPDTEVVPVQRLNEVFTALDKANDTGKRYVLDLAGSLNEEAFSSCTAAAPELGPNSTEMNMGAIIKNTFKMVLFH